MGDRGNIVITSDGETGVVLYTHWGGSNLQDVAKRALGRGRDNHTAYLARIVFSEMVKGDINGEIGYGITAWPEIHDNNHPILVLDTGLQEFRFIEETEGLRSSSGTPFSQI